jgi:hypothetical protein
MTRSISNFGVITIHPVFEPVPQERVADEAVRGIDAKIDQLLPRDDPGTKYWLSETGEPQSR